jgi:hypothetical protein
MRTRARAKGLADQRKDFSKYLGIADHLFYDYLISIDSLRELAREIGDTKPAQVNQASIDTIISDAEQRSKPRLVDNSAGDDSGEVVRDDEKFRKVLTMTQRELEARIARLQPGPRSNTEKRQLREKVLAASPRELAEIFGSLTNAWDTLVSVKLKTWQPDERRRSIDAWLIALVSECERFVRDFITVTLSTVGSDVSGLLDEFFSDEGLEIPIPTPSALIQHRRPLDAIVLAVSEYSEEGSAHTIEVAEALGDALDFEVFPEGSDFPPAGPYPEAGSNFCPGIHPGFVDLLEWTCPDGEKVSARLVWDSLVAFRRRTIHGPADFDRAGSSREHPIYEADVDQWQLITDFVGALGLRFALMLTTAIASRQPASKGRSQKSAGADPDTLRHKLSAEFRFVIKDLLSEQEARYALAWTLCELGMALEGGRAQAPMLTLNSFFARQKLGEGASGQTFINSQEIRDYEVSEKAKRYVLLKRSLLGEFKDISNLLDDVVHKEHNMARVEVEEWPALAALRRSAEYRSWNKKRPRLKLADKT